MKANLKAVKRILLKKHDLLVQDFVAVLSLYIDIINAVINYKCNSLFDESDMMAGLDFGCFVLM